MKRVIQDVVLSIQDIQDVPLLSVAFLACLWPPFSPSSPFRFLAVDLCLETLDFLQLYIIVQFVFKFLLCYLGALLTNHLETILQFPLAL